MVAIINLLLASNLEVLVTPPIATFASSTGALTSLLVPFACIEYKLSKLNVLWVNYGLTLLSVAVSSSSFSGIFLATALDSILVKLGTQDCRTRD